MSLAMYASDFNKDGIENNPIQRKEIICEIRH